MKDCDLIYSRYRKYFFINNLLSKKYNIPLVHEFNGSEVWVDKFWNKVQVDSLDQKLEDEMFDLAKKMEFEKAAVCRDKITSLKRKLIDL